MRFLPLPPPFLPYAGNRRLSRYSVVDSVGGDEDRAVDALLSMSDPDHVPSSAGAQAPAQPPVVCQPVSPGKSGFLKKKLLITKTK